MEKANTSSSNSKKLAGTMKGILDKSQKQLSKLSDHNVNKERKIGNIISLCLCFLLIGISTRIEETNWWIFSTAAIICCAWSIASEFIAAWWTKKRNAKDEQKIIYHMMRWVIIANIVMLILGIAIIVDRVAGIAKF